MQYQYITVIPEGKYFILFIFAFYIDYLHPHANVCLYRVDHKNETLSFIIITCDCLKNSCDYYNYHKSFETVSCDNYLQGCFVFKVHPEYAHICVRVRIIYVECKNNGNKIFPNTYFSNVFSIFLH